MSQPRDVIAQMWYSRDVRHEDLAGRKCAKCCVFSIVSRLRWPGKSAPKNGRARRIGCSRCGKICTTPARETKSLKTESLGRLLEVEVAKICTTPARESDLEVKIVKNCHGRSKVQVAKICTTPARESDLEAKIVKNWGHGNTFGSWSRQNLHHACARERFGSQNR